MLLYCLYIKDIKNGAIHIVKCDTFLPPPCQKMGHVLFSKIGPFSKLFGFEI